MDQYVSNNGLSINYLISDSSTTTITGCSTWSFKKPFNESFASRIQLSMSELPANLLCRKSHNETIETPTAPKV